MRDVAQTMRETTTPAEKMAARFDSVKAAFEAGKIPLKNYNRYIEEFNRLSEEEARKLKAVQGNLTGANAGVNKNAAAMKGMAGEYASGLPVVGRFAGMIGRIPGPAIAVAAGIGAIGAAFGVAAGLAKKFADISIRNIGDQFKEIDEVAKASKATGFGFAEITGLGRAGELTSGVASADVTKALGLFTKNLGDVVIGTGEAKQAIESMGMSAEELARMTPGEALLKVSDGMKGVTGSAERAAIAQKLFGRAGKQLVPMLVEGGDALKQYIEQAKGLRLDMDPEAVASVEAFNDAVTDLGNAWTGFWRDAAGAIAPGLAEAMEDLNEAIASDRAQSAMDSMIIKYQMLGEIAPGYLRAVQHDLEVLGTEAEAVSKATPLTWVTPLGIAMDALRRSTAGTIGPLEDATEQSIALDKELKALSEQTGANEFKLSISEKEAESVKAFAEAEAEAAETLEKAQERLRQTTEKTVEDLKLQIATFGMSATDAEIVKLGWEGVDPDELDRLQDMMQQLDELKEKQKAADDEEKERKKAAAEAEKSQQKAAADAEKERQTLMEKGRRLTESLRTEEEKRADSLAENRDLWLAGAIDIDTWSRSMEESFDKDFPGGPGDDNKRQALGPTQAEAYGSSSSVLAFRSARLGLMDKMGGGGITSPEQALVEKTEEGNKFLGQLAGLMGRVEANTKLMADDPGRVKVAGSLN